MIPAYRICSTRYAFGAFSGEDAKMAGGRWNSPGLLMVYCSSSLSLATLEILVHLEEPEILARHFSYFEIAIPKAMIQPLDPAKIPSNWRFEGAFPQTSALGDAWLRSMKSAVLSVPSAVTPGEVNYLLNPRHPDYGKIRIGEEQRFEPDPRLAR
ncbi:MAG: RES domain-containing protein [Luteolibacter sp.]